MLKFILPSLLIVLFSPAAFAALGDHVSAIANDKEVMKAASATSTETTNYTVHELTTDGNVVREYASNEGVVFAVTWRGVKKPDLSLLLGSYYTEFNSADKKRKKMRGRQPVAVKTSSVVVRRGGHMRDMHGRAFITELVPAGVDVESLP
jgi:hypothetical protein